MPAETTACPDGELARRVADGGASARQAEAELCRRFAKRVRLYGLRNLPSEAAADDLVQNVLTLTLRRLRAGEVREPERIASFVLGTARTLSRTSARAQRLERDELDDAALACVGAQPSLPDPFASARLEQALGELDERERSVVLLTYYAQHDAGEIAQALGLEAGHVRVLRHRAIARLRRAMDIDPDGAS